MKEMKPYVVVFVIQTIYAAMYLLSKAAFDHGINNFIFVFYRQAVATIFLIPFAFIFEWYVLVWIVKLKILISWLINSLCIFIHLISLLQETCTPSVFQDLLQDFPSFFLRVYTSKYYSLYFRVLLTGVSGALVKHTKRELLP